ncbi:MAG: two-component system, cell cycle response regulator [Thermoanaerobaculia bacterium]|jgi:diguanylate cyclase (GGDEF)-like protein|nr:two-component system, cell cycle response regulator [Thermoanaerobaculia bacterium]
MSWFAEDAAGRIVRSLSTLLHKELSLVDPASAEDAIVLTPNLAVKDDPSLSAPQRDLVREVASIVRFAGARDGRARELELKIAELETRNLDLLLKNRTLADISARDTLTGLYNRWYVMEKIDSEMNRSLRNGSPVSVLMLDIDHFKRVNDEFGHSAGDGVLRSVAQVLRESCRVYDVPGRYGGEEFCVVLPETKAGNTTVVAERIRERMAASSFDVGSDSVVVTASIGIAGIDSAEGEGMVSPSTLIDRADRALYSAKHHGRNRVELWNVAMHGAAMGH